MRASCLRVVLAENGLTETGLTLRSLCAEAGRVLELVRVGERKDLVQVLRAHRPDVALLKLALLQPDVVEQLRVLQENMPSIPLILLAERADKFSVNMCVALGAADYLVEGYLDERTMNRVLSSAIGERWPSGMSGVGDEQTLFPVAQGDADLSWTREGEQECAFTLVVGDGEGDLEGDVEGMPSRFGAGAETRALSEVAEILRRSVRATDRVEVVSERELTVRIRFLSEAQIVAVERRIEAKLWNHPFPLLRQLNLGLQRTHEMKESTTEIAAVLTAESSATQETRLC